MMGSGFRAISRYTLATLGHFGYSTAVTAKHLSPCTQKRRDGRPGEIRTPDPRFRKPVPPRPSCSESSVFSWFRYPSFESTDPIRARICTPKCTSQVSSYSIAIGSPCAAGQSFACSLLDCNSFVQVSPINKDLLHSRLHCRDGKASETSVDLFNGQSHPSVEPPNQKPQKAIRKKLHNGFRWYNRWRQYRWCSMPMPRPRACSARPSLRITDPRREKDPTRLLKTMGATRVSGTLTLGPGL
jgi:hypothetical protein